MSAEREKLKRMIDNIPDQDVLEVFDFIQKLSLKRGQELSHQDINFVAEDKEIIEQVKKSRIDRSNGRVFDQEEGFQYLKNKIEEFEREQNL